ncbi:methyl-accepting chemotaxis protein [Spirochaetia bacterium]|nr:methyl-accepting chemotaxis protein [Spirochaetia bacterium]
MSLSKRVSLLIGILIFFVTVLTGITSLIVATGTVEETTEQSLESLAGLGAEMAGVTIQSDLHIIQELANRAHTRSLVWETQRDSLAGDIDREGYLDMGIVGMDGIAHYIKDDTTANLADRDYIIKALRGEQAVSDVLISRVINKPVVMFAVPITVDNKVMGALIVRKEGSELSNITDRIGIGTNGYAYMINRSGVMISHRNTNYVLEQFAPIEAAKKDPSLKSLGDVIAKMIIKGKGVDSYTFGGQAMMVGYAPVPGLNWILAATAARTDLMGGVNTLRNLIIVFGLVFLAIGIGAALLIGRSITRPILNMIPLLEGVSNGDLSEKLVVTSKDEVRTMAEKYNNSMGSLSTMVSHTKNAAISLEEMANRLYENMQKTTEAVHFISNAISSIKQKTINQVTSVTETHATIGEVKNHTEDLNSSIEHQSTAVAQSSSAIEQMVANIKSVADILVKNTESMDKLLKASETGKEGIQQVTAVLKTLENDSQGLLEASTMIQSIAGQTNLLAMNAAIEAAHAGEAGRGFAVVADEIRKLAENSSTQGKSISTVLNNLKNQINAATGVANESQERFTLVLELINKVQNQEAVIKGAMEEQTTGSTQILEAMHKIHEITSQVKDRSLEMTQASSTIMEEMTHLAGATEETNEEMDGIAGNTDQINAAISNLNQITGETRESISKLSQDVSRFKVAG